MTTRADRSNVDYPSGRFLAKIDITTFYKAIYTHSLPWAIDGLRAAKASKGSAQGWADGLDKLLQLSRRKETSGIPIGPGTSAVVGEILLGQVDKNLSARGISTPYLRFVDDYYCVTTGRDEAEAFIQTVRAELSALRLNIHPSKTEIIDLPYSQSPLWKRRLRASLGPDPKIIHFLDALDEVIESATHADEDSAMRYVLITLEEKLRAAPPGSSPVQIDSIASRLLNMAFAYPVVVGTICRILPSATMGGSAATVASLNEILVEHASKRRTDAVTWILYFLLKNDLDITEDSANAVVASNDCLSLALLAHSARWEHRVGDFLRSFESKNPQDYDRDEYWLLYYHFLAKGQTPTQLPPSYRSELELLRDQDLKFVDLDREGEFDTLSPSRTPRTKSSPLPTQSPYDISVWDY